MPSMWHVTRRPHFADPNAEGPWTVDGHECLHPCGVSFFRVK